MRRTVQIVRVGKWKNPQGDEIIITGKDLKEIVKNFNSRIDKIGIPILYKDSFNLIGWIEKLNIKNQKLYVVIEWKNNNQFKNKCNYLTSEFDFDSRNGATLVSAIVEDKLKVLKPIKKGNLTK